MVDACTVDVFSKTIPELRVYSETSLNRTLKKPALPEYRPIFKVPA
jgi:hypothetical protein